MTEQAVDIVVFKGENHYLIGVEGDNMMTPEQFGMLPKMMNTACRRGYIATYAITKSRLLLKKLWINDERDIYPPIDQFKPEVSEYWAIYNEMRVLIKFTGILTIARDFIPRFNLPWEFRRLTEPLKAFDITFNEGKVIKVEDLYYKYFCKE